MTAIQTESRGVADTAAYVDAYDDLLAAPGVADATAEALARGAVEQRLTFAGRQLTVSLRPNLLTSDRLHALTVAATTITSALQQVERAAAASPLVRAELALDPEEERLALADPNLGSPLPTTRLDSFFGADVRFVENGGESQAGMAYQDHATIAYDGLPVMQAFARRFRARPLPLRQHQLGALLAEYRGWGGRRLPRIAIVDWAGVPTAVEFEMFAEYYARHGIRSTICDPTELEVRADRLYAAGAPVDLVYRRVLTAELLARPRDARALVEAYVRGLACIVSPFRAKIVHKKSALAVLTDDRFASLFSTVQRRAIDRHIPWTRLLRSGPSTRDGMRLPDLVEHVLDRRASLVLKPNDAYGGRGVVLGSDVDQAAWEAAVGRALDEPSVVQEAVEVPTEMFPMVVQGRLEYQAQSVDLDPFLFHGRAVGAVSRISGAGLQNVTAGTGSFVPTYVVGTR